MNKIFIKIGANKYDAADYSFPAERTFRDAWSVNDRPQDGVITVDMDKARNVWRDKIRAARLEEFAVLDAEFLRALESNGDTKAIAARKKELRDAPADSAIDAANTPEALKAVQPARLTVK
jgi:hypothetical protein